MRSPKPLRFLSSTVVSDGIAQVMSSTLSVLLVGAVTPVLEVVSAPPACQMTTPLKASTTKIPRPLVREMVVVVAGLGPPVIVHDPLEVYVTLPLPTFFCFTCVSVDSESRQGLMSS